MDAWFVTTVVLGIITKSSTVLSAEWQTSPNQVIYACKGTLVQFPWKLNLDPRSEFVETVHWFYQGTFSSDLFATHTHGQFLPALKYAGRVEQLLDRGVALHDVTPSDSGNYSVEALVRQSNASLVSHLYSQSVYLQVSDGLMVHGGRLEVTQDPVALWDNTSEQWTIRLWCGLFTFMGQPPVRVEWIMPSGDKRPSSGYSGGRFYLSLAAPVLPEGNYTCRVPQQFYPDLCSTDMRADKLLGADLLQASIVVDEVRARLTLAEAELGRLRLDNGRLESTVQNLTDSLSGLKSELMQMQQSLMSEIYALWNETKHIKGLKSELLHMQHLLMGEKQELSNATKPIEELRVNLRTGEVSSGSLGEGMSWVVPLYTPSDTTGSCVARGVLKLSFDQSSRKRAILNFVLQNPTGFSFNIGDSLTNNAYGGDFLTQRNDAEVHSRGDEIFFFGKTKAPGEHWGILFNRRGVVTTGNLTINVQDELATAANDRFDAYVNSWKMFALNNQPDVDGPVNNDIFVGINRVIDGDYRSGTGVCELSVIFSNTTI